MKIVQSKVTNAKNAETDATLPSKGKIGALNLTTTQI